jgi:Icc-related predicted phosphoesterase
MYTSTAKILNQTNTSYLFSLKKTARIKIRCSADVPKQKKTKICLFHGSPADPDEFLFDTTPKSRFRQLSEQVRCDVIITGHSHTPYCKTVSGTTFINPGSVGRMFDKDPRASCATLELTDNTISVQHLRISYKIDAVITKLKKEKLPSIYAEMFKRGEKLN